MKAHPLTARVVQQPVQPLAHHRGQQRRVLLLGGRKQPSGNIPFPVLSEHLQHFGWQEQGAYRRLCFQLGDHHLRAYDHRLLADSHFARGQIQVLPLQGRQLSQPQFCGKFQQEQLVVLFLLRLDQQLLHGLPREEIHFPFSGGRQLAAGRRVLWNQVFRYRPFQRPPAQAVDVAELGVRQPRFTVRLVRTPLCFQPDEELLHILRGQPVQRDMTQPRSDVQPEVAFVDPPCAGTGGGSAVRLIPVLHPVPEGHICPGPRRCRRRKGVLQRFQLLHTLRFCFSQHIFRFRQTLVIVADDHASFPSAVLSQADSSFSVFSFSCHGFSSSPKISVKNSSTISAALFCISPVVWV